MPMHSPPYGRLLLWLSQRVLEPTAVNVDWLQLAIEFTPNDYASIPIRSVAVAPTHRRLRSLGPGFPLSKVHMHGHGPQHAPWWLYIIGRSECPCADVTHVWCVGCPSLLCLLHCVFSWPRPEVHSKHIACLPASRSPCAILCFYSYRMTLISFATVPGLHSLASTVCKTP